MAAGESLQQSHELPAWSMNVEADVKDHLILSVVRTSAAVGPETALQGELVGRVSLSWAPSRASERT